ncbi:MAG: glutathione S-transferase [Variovorax sp.]|nr:MAG: glutathione S-transferase [Variovorax sp.]
MAPSPLALPVLYSFRRCPYAIRARLALLASGQACELREVVLKNKPPALLAASPKGTVPVLVLPDGIVIDQSLDIMRWALRRHDPMGWLGPEGTCSSEVLALIAQCDGDFKQQLDRYKYPHRSAAGGAAIGSLPSARDQAGAFVMQLEQRLAAHGCLAGPRTSLADVALMPFVRQFAGVEPVWFAAQPWSHVRAWLEGWTGSPLFASAMHRYPAWAAGQIAVPLCPNAMPLVPN